MRINKYIALHTSLSRRRADEAVVCGRVKINGLEAALGSIVENNDEVLLDDVPVRGVLPDRTVLLLHKPVGYVCSRQGQGSKTIFDLLPDKYKTLKPAGRLDKDSSGLLILSNDGDLLQELTHPSKLKEKIYLVMLNNPLSKEHQAQIGKGVELEDGISALGLEPLDKSRFEWRISMTEGRNRQIRRTFNSLGYNVINLHRTIFGGYKIGNLAPGKYIEVS
jgi:pseudouridine synthase